MPMEQMFDHNLPVQPLKKITLSVNASTQAEGNNSDNDSQTFQFIFGLGTDGLTPFEFLLSKQMQNHIFSLKLHPDDICQTFKHINVPHFDIPESAESIFFTFQMIKVEEADHREVIKAMAELSSCGGSCECCAH
jgi:hypothetical protein